MRPRRRRSASAAPADRAGTRRGRARTPRCRCASSAVRGPGPMRLADGLQGGVEVGTSPVSAWGDTTMWMSWAPSGSSSTVQRALNRSPRRSIASGRGPKATTVVRRRPSSPVVVEAQPLVVERAPRWRERAAAPCRTHVEHVREVRGEGHLEGQPERLQREPAQPQAHVQPPVRDQDVPLQRDGLLRDLAPGRSRPQVRVRRLDGRVEGIVVGRREQDRIAAGQRHGQLGQVPRVARVQAEAARRAGPDVTARARAHEQRALLDHQDVLVALRPRVGDLRPGFVAGPVGGDVGGLLEDPEACELGRRAPCGLDAQTVSATPEGTAAEASVPAHRVLARLASAHEDAEHPPAPVHAALDPHVRVVDAPRRPPRDDRAVAAGAGRRSGSCGRSPPVPPAPRRSR